MVTLAGYLRAMKHQPDVPVSYHFSTDTEDTPMAAWLGKSIHISFTGERRCVHCGRQVKKLYQGGYCYPCTTALAECDLCIVKPQLCHYHNGTCRDENFAVHHCMVPHSIYLAYSSEVKVGLTRSGREDTRWVDQGASAAVVIAQVNTRREAGELEVAMMEWLPDKTQWRKMVVFDDNQTAREQVRQRRAEMLLRLPPNPGITMIRDAPISTFTYPRLTGERPVAKSVPLPSENTVSGRLIGVKGQYLLFDDGVLNIRRHAGMKVEVRVK